VEDKPVFFVDDVFGAGHIGFIKQLCSRLKPLSARYTLICDLRMVTDEVIRTLAMSGCRMMCFDIFGAGTPEEIKTVRAIRAAGMEVLTYFMFGFEQQRKDVFQRVIDFVNECKIRHVAMVLLAPYAGTPMFKRLEAEGRIITKNWCLYDQAHVVFKPANMTAQELEEGFDFVHKEIGDLYNIERVIGEVFSKERL
jgi:radical SAM superfamily enzyme YgiQ (UPF0313 family)